MNYLLIGSKEGGDWKYATIFSFGTLDKIKEVFRVRKRPFILWYLIDVSKMSSKYNDFRQLDLLFFDVQKEHPDLVEKDYNYEPFVGFFDIVATARSWGKLKEIAENEKPPDLSS